MATALKGPTVQMGRQSCELTVTAEDSEYSKAQWGGGRRQSTVDSKRKNSISDTRQMRRLSSRLGEQATQRDGIMGKHGSLDATSKSVLLVHKEARGREEELQQIASDGQTGQLTHDLESCAEKLSRLKAVVIRHFGFQTPWSI